MVLLAWSFTAPSRIRLFDATIIPSLIRTQDTLILINLIASFKALFRISRGARCLILRAILLKTMESPGFSRSRTTPLGHPRHCRLGAAPGRDSRDFGRPAKVSRHCNLYKRDRSSAQSEPSPRTRTSAPAALFFGSVSLVWTHRNVRRPAMTPLPEWTTVNLTSETRPRPLALTSRSGLPYA